MKQQKTGIFDIVNVCMLAVFSLITLYPFIYVLSMSLSSADAILTQKVWLYPVGFSVKSYGMLFMNNNLVNSYMNTIWYVAVGTSINLIATTTAAYALSRKRFFARNFIMVFISITMIFEGGMIPSFIIVNRLGLYNTRWAIVLVAAVSPWLMLVNRTFFDTSIPESLVEAAGIDGYSDIGIFLRVILPLSKPILAVLAIFYGVAHWNSWFSALIYLSDQKLAPVQLLLRKIILSNSKEFLSGLASDMDRVAYSQQLKYSSIIVVIAPVLAIYPFAQKYFIQGVMIGAIKE